MHEEWIKNCQQVTYHKEISNMLSKSSPRIALVHQLRLFLENTGLICCGGRIHNVPVSESAKFPHLLPPKDPFTELVIRDTHIRQLHAGENSTPTALRLCYWIPAGRQHVKKAISNCVTCKKISGLYYYYLLLRAPQQEQSISKSSQIYQYRPSSLHIDDLQLGNLFLSK